MRSAHAALAAALLTVSASALAINEGFETGTTAGHFLTVPSGGSAEVVSSFASYSPAEGSHFLLLKTDGPGSFTTARQVYKLKAGDRLGGYAAFASRDSLPYNDNMQVRIRYGLTIVATPFAADVASTGANVDGPWTPWSYTAPADGIYTVEYRIANEGDAVVDSYALFDARELSIDIKPGDSRNEINPSGPGVFPVATLGSAGFDVTTIDRSTIRFGTNGRNTEGPDFYTDLGGDGFTDIITTVKTSDTGISCSTRFAYITARLYTGELISGSDRVKPVGSSCD
jgi:hypothetical protein